jgi:tetratricopeptide (TPR) repeat protein
MVPNLSRQRILALANQLLEAGDLGGAERALAPLMGARPDAELLGMIGALRLRQNQPGQAESLLAQACAAAPKEPVHALNLGRARAALDQFEGAISAYRAAIKLNSGLTPAYFELAALQQRAGKLEDAEATYRKLLRAMPDNTQARLMLGLVVMENGRPADAEVLLRRALTDTTDDKALVGLRNGLAWAIRRQNRHEEALAEFDAVGRLDPTLPFVDIQRAEIMQDLRRYDEALEIFRMALQREPLNAHLHCAYNDLLYRLDRKEEFLASYGRVPKTRALMVDKAAFLAQDNRAREAYELLRAVLAHDPTDVVAATGAAHMLSLLGQHGEASQAFDRLLARHGNDADICNNAAEAALRGGDPHKSLVLYQQTLRVSPHNQTALAGSSVGLRLLNDERDEILNGYDSLIQQFDLEPPEGFSSMAEFNGELDAYLDSLHPRTREYISQSLRGGTQTPAHLFGAGHELVEHLQERISEAVTRYIAGLKEDTSHPFLSRRSGNFRYAGSWSSRLRDCGFHTNHIHPSGWISSCYYVGVPPAVADETSRQGWIKFGEPSIEVGLSMRRAIQPVAGRLVLFPSYMWHGTIPFHDAHPRTTIAFDVVPTG